MLLKRRTVHNTSRKSKTLLGGWQSAPRRVKGSGHQGPGTKLLIFMP